MVIYSQSRRLSSTTAYTISVSSRECFARKWRCSVLGSLSSERACAQTHIRYQLAPEKVGSQIGSAGERVAKNWKCCPFGDFPHNQITYFFRPPSWLSNHIFRALNPARLWRVQVSFHLSLSTCVH